MGAFLLIRVVVDLIDQISSQSHYLFRTSNDIVDKGEVPRTDNLGFVSAWSNTTRRLGSPWLDGDCFSLCKFLIK